MEGYLAVENISDFFFVLRVMYTSSPHCEYWKITTNFLRDFQRKMYAYIHWYQDIFDEKKSMNTFSYANVDKPF